MARYWTPGPNPRLPTMVELIGTRCRHLLLAYFFDGNGDTCWWHKLLAQPGCKQFLFSTHDFLLEVCGFSPAALKQTRPSEACMYRGNNDVHSRTKNGKAQLLDPSLHNVLMFLFVWVHFPHDFLFTSTSFDRKYLYGHKLPGCWMFGWLACWLAGLAGWLANKIHAT